MINVGHRYSKLVYFAEMLSQEDMKVNDMFAILQIINRACCVKPLSDDQLRGIAEDLGSKL